MHQTYSEIDSNLLDDRSNGVHHGFLLTWDSKVAVRSETNETDANKLEEVGEEWEAVYSADNACGEIKGKKSTKSNGNNCRLVIGGLPLGLELTGNLAGLFGDSVSQL